MDVKEVIKALGGPTKVAARLDSARRDGKITVAAVSKWKRIPANRVRDLVQMSDGKLKAEELRPDIFAPRDADREAA